MKKIYLYLFLSIFSFLRVSAQTNLSENPLLQKAQAVISEIQKKYAPDRRTVRFEIAAELNSAHKILLKGDTEIALAKKEILEKLKEQSLDVEENIEILPQANLEKPFAIVRVSVANVRSAPKHSAELATQTLLGTVLRILKKQDGWYLVQTPDKYLAWVDGGAIRETNLTEKTDWLKAKKVIYTESAGFSRSFSDPSQTVSDLVWGNLLQKAEVKKGEKIPKGMIKILYPDGREALVRNTEVQDLEKWTQKTKISKENLVSSAKKMMGLPYLWGGTSFKGVDCSGFTKTAYLMNGLVIPRDASQQVWEGETVETPNKDFSRLEAGDLLFFGKASSDSSSEKVTHVGMWLGNGEFIHASNLVRIGSMDKKSPIYDDFEYNRFLRAKLLIGQNTKGLQIFSQTLE